MADEPPRGIEASAPASSGARIVAIVLGALALLSVSAAAYSAIPGLLLDDFAERPLHHRGGMLHVMTFGPSDDARRAHGPPVAADVQVARVADDGSPAVVFSGDPDARRGVRLVLEPGHYVVNVTYGNGASNETVVTVRQALMVGAYPDDGDVAFRVHEPHHRMPFHGRMPGAGPGAHPGPPPMHDGPHAHGEGPRHR